MGQAKQRGTREERVQAAVQREQERQLEIKRRRELMMSNLQRGHEVHTAAREDAKRQVLNGSNRRAHFSLAAAIALAIGSSLPRY